LGNQTLKTGDGRDLPSTIARATALPFVAGIRRRCSDSGGVPVLIGGRKDAAMPEQIPLFA
jgi:hypothetical protein